MTLIPDSACFVAGEMQIPLSREGIRWVACWGRPNVRFTCCSICVVAVDAALHVPDGPSGLVVFAHGSGSDRFSR